MGCFNLYFGGYIMTKKITLVGSCVSRCVCLVVALALAGCAKDKGKGDMSLQELSDKSTEALKKNKREEAINYLEEIIGRFPDNANISRYKMQLAETYFKDGRYAAAQEVYEHLNQFYPSDKSAEYAKYKSIQSMFKQSLNSDCDQTETEEVVKLCQEYLQNTSYNQYKNEIIAMRKECENKLIDKEVYVFNFYIKESTKDPKRKHQFLDAAHNRIKFIREKYLADHPTLEPQILYLESKLAQREKNKTLVKETINTLTQKYPESQYTQLAQGLTHRTPFIF